MNIVLVFTDQQHKNALGRMDPTYQTPNLDALADEGTLFTNAYSANPVCGPYRGCLMTGLLTSHNGLRKNNMPLPESVPTLAGQLRSQGWQTCFVGKWHLGGKGNQPIPQEIRGGFELFRGYQMYNGYIPSEPYNNTVSFWDEHGNEHLFQEHRTEVTTQLAVDAIHELAQKPVPFCLVVAYQAPHYPEQPLPEYEKLYENTHFHVAAEENGVEPYTPTFNPRSPEDWTQCPDYQRYGGNMEKYRQLYAAMVSQVDHGVGRIITTLKQEHCYEDTLVIFTSDHGDMQGSHGLTNKRVHYEMSAGVPMIIRHPHGRSACRSDELICGGIDVFATIMDAAGIAQHGDGQSVFSYVAGASNTTGNEAIISESLDGDPCWQMIRSKRHKLVVSWPDHQPMALYDMIADPEEKNNLLCTGENHSELIRTLCNKLDEKINHCSR